MIDRIKSVLTKLGFCAKDVDSLSQDIFNTYTSAERYYHNINHIYKMLNNFDDFMRCSGCADQIKNINDFKYEDFTIVGYKSYPTVKYELNVGL